MWCEKNMLWEEVMDNSQYEATHYNYLEIRGNSSSTKNYNNVVNELSLPFVDFSKAVGRNSIKKGSDHTFTNIASKNAQKEYEVDMWIQKVIDYYKNNHYDFFSRTSLNDEPVVLDGFIMAKTCRFLQS